MALPPNFWFWPTPAVATVALPGAWKIQLQSQVCNPFGIAITIAHYPTGASKWNPIEHRLFSEISKNWAAEPLDSYEKMLKIHSHHRHSNRLGRDRLSRPKRVSNPSQARPAVDLFTAPHSRQSTPALELYDPTESVKLFLRSPLVSNRLGGEMTAGILRAV